MNKLDGVVVVHFDEDGDWSYHVFGEKVRLFIVDERAPNDRVYEYLSRSEPSYLRDLIPAGSDIGNQNDERHEAIKHRVLSAGEGRSHLSLVESDHE